MKLSRETELGKLVEEGRLRIRKDGTAYSSTGNDKEAEELNVKLDDVRRGIDTIKNVHISAAFMKNYEHNVKMLKEAGSKSILDYDNRNVIKPAELITEVDALVREAELTHTPITVATLCH